MVIACRVPYASTNRMYLPKRCLGIMVLPAWPVSAVAPQGTAIPRSHSVPTKRCYNGPLAALDAGHEATLLPCRRDEIAAADAVRSAVVRGERIGKGTPGRFRLVLRLLRLGDPRPRLAGRRDLGSRLYGLERRQQRLPAGHEMGNRWGRGRGRTGIFGQRQCWCGAALEPLWPGCGMRRLRRGGLVA